MECCTDYSGHPPECHGNLFTVHNIIVVLKVTCVDYTIKLDYIIKVTCSSYARFILL